MKEDEQLLWEAYTKRIINETVNNPATRERVGKALQSPDIDDDQRADILQVLQTLEKMSAAHVPEETIQSKLRQAIDRFTKRGGLTEDDDELEQDEPEYDTNYNLVDTSSGEDNPGQESILSRLQDLEKLLPHDANIEWKIENGSYGGINPHDVAGDKPNTPGPEHRTISVLIDTLQRVWEDEEFAKEVGLARADWSGASNYNKEIFWTANDTHYQNVFGNEVFMNRSQLKPEHEAPYKEFQVAKRKTDTYVKAVLNGKEAPEGGQGVERRDFVNQKHWRIVIQPRSEETQSRAGATSHAVYPKLFNPDGSRKDIPGGAYVGD